MSKLNGLLAVTAGAVFAAGVACAPVAVAQGSSPQTNPSYPQTSQNANQMNMQNNNSEASKMHNKALQHSDVQAAIAKLKKADPKINDFFQNAYGYAVFPSVGKGGLVLGGAYGDGEVYQNGQLVGHATITKFDIGAQIGGETFSEVVFFKDQNAFNHFTGGNYQFSADATAVAVKSGATANNDYDDGVAIFTMAKGGLMAGVSIGGQKFSYTPVSQANNPNE